DHLLKGDAGFLLQREETLAKEFYLETVMNGLTPTVVVDYDRIPLVFPGGDVRITFDEHIRAGRFGRDLFQKELPSYEVLPEGKLILEVKFTEYLPEIIRDLLPAEEAAVIAASKYVLCLRKQREMLFHQGEE
ncbi:MAG: VTC domain-containing protein, partial [Lachnospiraceae bacterium]|nr:VTC domain-containing protein [Lachnospiraceae bacterium]